MPEDKSAVGAAVVRDIVEHDFCFVVFDDDENNANIGKQVYASRMTIESGGTLCFWNWTGGSGSLIRAYAKGQWFRVHRVEL